MTHWKKKGRGHWRKRMSHWKKGDWKKKMDMWKKKGHEHWKKGGKGHWRNWTHEKKNTVRSSDPDPKRDYFLKKGAEFAQTFLLTTHVNAFDEVDLYECLEREPRALIEFYKADETLKDALINKKPDEGIKGLDELMEFIVEMIVEDYPHTHVEVCRTIDHSKSNFNDIKKIMEDMRNGDLTLSYHHDKLFFNHHDITEETSHSIDAYIHGDFSRIGYELGNAMRKAAED